MNIILEILGALVMAFIIALAMAFIIAFVKYEITSIIFKHKAEKEMEDLVKRNRDFYNDDDYEDMY